MHDADYPSVKAIKILVNNINYITYNSKRLNSKCIFDFAIKKP